MRELLGELILELKEPRMALKEFETSLGDSRNRFRGYYGAAKAAELTGDRRKAADFYKKLLVLAKNADGTRPELEQARGYLAALDLR
jgi:hypothetical protein